MVLQRDLLTLAELRGEPSHWTQLFDSQANDNYRDVGGKTLREAMQCSHGKYRMECINLSRQRAQRERAAGDT